MSAKQICQYCNSVLTAGTAHEFDGVIMCEDCLDERTVVCERCGERMWEDDAVTDDDYTLCQSCYDDHYNRCEECNAIISNKSLSALLAGAVLKSLAIKARCYIHPLLAAEYNIFKERT